MPKVKEFYHLKKTERSDTTTLVTLVTLVTLGTFIIITLPDASKVKKLDITDNNSYNTKLFLVLLPDGFVFAASYGNHFITTTPIELKLN